VAPELLADRIHHDHLAVREAEVRLSTVCDHHHDHRGNHRDRGDHAVGSHDHHHRGSHHPAACSVASFVSVPLSMAAFLHRDQVGFEAEVHRATASPQGSSSHRIHHPAVASKCSEVRHL
jgi:hypothetical protein